MNRIVGLVMLTLLASGYWTDVMAQVKMSGDAKVWVTDESSPKAGKGNESMTLWEKSRLRTDFIANDDLKFRLGIRVNNNGPLKNPENIGR